MLALGCGSMFGCGSIFGTAGCASIGAPGCGSIFGAPGCGSIGGYCIIGIIGAILYGFSGIDMGYEYAKFCGGCGGGEATGDMNSTRLDRVLIGVCKSGFGGAGGTCTTLRATRTGEVLISAGAENPRGARCNGDGAGITTHGLIQ